MLGTASTIDTNCCVDMMQAQKDLIESMIAEDDKIEGLEHIECKVFK